MPIITRETVTRIYDGTKGKPAERAAKTHALIGKELLNGLEVEETLHPLLRAMWNHWFKTKALASEWKANEAKTTEAKTTGKHLLEAYREHAEVLGRAAEHISLTQRQNLNAYLASLKHGAIIPLEQTTSPTKAKTEAHTQERAEPSGQSRTPEHAKPLKQTHTPERAEPLKQTHTPERKRLLELMQKITLETMKHILPEGTRETFAEEHKYAGIYLDELAEHGKQK